MCLFRTMYVLRETSYKNNENEVRIETCFVKVPNEHILKDKAFFYVKLQIKTVFGTPNAEVQVTPLIYFSHSKSQNKLACAS